MKKLVFFLLISSAYCFGQDTEFQTYGNGLIYDESTMNKLGRIVDSLNLKFKSCELSNTYHALPQGMATVVKVTSKAQLKLIQDGIGIEALLKKFPNKLLKKNVWIVQNRYTGYDGEKYLTYAGLPSGSSEEISIEVKDKITNDKNTGWIVDDDGTQALYLEKLESKILPLEYAKLVHYVDCMIDTTTSIYSRQAERDHIIRNERDPKVKKFLELVSDFPNKPEYPTYSNHNEKSFDSLFSIYHINYIIWDSLRVLAIDKKMLEQHAKTALADAFNEALDSGGSGESLEFYVTRYRSKEDALKLRRSYKVVGNCSMDQRPRYHAMRICQLAAETTQWDIFLRSHLDIMNDRFERRTDGSYAWGRRKTYLKELEDLDIDAVNLLIGTCLSVDQVNENHYWGSISRIGRALADTSEKENLEAQLLKMIADENLDPYNRILIAYLFRRYNNNLDDQIRKAVNNEKIKTAINTAPGFLKERLRKI